MKLALCAVGMFLCVIVVGCLERPEDSVLAEATFTMPADVGIADNDEIVMGQPMKLDCACQYGHWGMEPQASICQSSPDGASRGCYYVRGQPIYWANEKREESPL